MGCGGSSSAAAAQEPRPRAQPSNGVELAPGQCAIIRNCPNARLNGEQVILQEYNYGLGEWTVKGDKFPLSIGMSLGAQFLEVDKPALTLLTSESCAQSKAHTCPSGHVLERHEAPNEDFTCDVCGKEVAEGETLWGCRRCDYDRCQQCLNPGIVEFTDTDGDKVVLKDNSTYGNGIDFYVDGVLRVHDLIKLRVSDRTIVLEGERAEKYAAATVPIGQEYILQQALNLFAEIQSRKGL
jgi:hypothetical protein